MNIGRRRRTVYIEPIEDPAGPPKEEPTPAPDPERADPRPGLTPELEPAR
jgi:hypothetical protein